MLNCFVTQAQGEAIPIEFLTEENFESWLKSQDESDRSWILATAFKAKQGTICLVPDTKAHIKKVLLGMGSSLDMQTISQLSASLPKGIYYFATALSQQQEYLANLFWGLGFYQFTPYKKFPSLEAQLKLNDPNHLSKLESLISTNFLVRDLINTPTEDMGPAELAEAAIKIAEEFSADAKQLIGDELLEQGFPAIHMVGRASDHAPRLIDIRWGNPRHPKVTLVGKGVCFDTGGLDIKSSSGMALMRKDMAGAAHVLGLARLIMAAQLPIRLRILIPAVENAISGDAYRPGDIIRTRKGITVEVTNTDAEGRLILCDALAEAATEKPDLIIDIASLTGAAKVALGTEVTALFSQNDVLAKKISETGLKEAEPIWPMPLYKPYRRLLDSNFADIINASMSGYAGAITAALFLKEFVPDDIDWLHFDIMAWNMANKPGRPEGAEAVTLRSLFSYLQERYNKQ